MSACFSLLLISHKKLLCNKLAAKLADGLKSVLFLSTLSVILFFLLVSPSLPSVSMSLSPCPLCMSTSHSPSLCFYLSLQELKEGQKEFESKSRLNCPSGSGLSWETSSSNQDSLFRNNLPPLQRKLISGNTAKPKKQQAVVLPLQGQSGAALHLHIHVVIYWGRLRSGGT